MGADIRQQCLGATTPGIVLVILFEIALDKTLGALRLTHRKKTVLFFRVHGEVCGLTRGKKRAPIFVYALNALHIEWMIAKCGKTELTQ